MLLRGNEAASGPPETRRLNILMGVLVDYMGRHPWDVDYPEA